MKKKTLVLDSSYSQELSSIETGILLNKLHARNYTYAFWISMSAYGAIIYYLINGDINNLNYVSIGMILFFSLPWWQFLLKKWMHECLINDSIIDYIKLLIQFYKKKKTWMPEGEDFPITNSFDSILKAVGKNNDFDMVKFAIPKRGKWEWPFKTPTKDKLVRNFLSLNI